MLISVIISTYNRPDALCAVLRALSKQSDGRFEAVVADDGSAAETASVVARWKERRKFPIAYVRHEDRGFRLAEIRNRAIIESTGDYVVFLDGDCIAPFDFIESHRKLAERDWMVFGHRLLLTPAFTDMILRTKCPIEEWSLRRWIRAKSDGSIDRIVPLLRIPGQGWRRWLGRRNIKKVRGCNMAVWRSDLDAVDGFDADFTGWGHEDHDLAARLVMRGVALKDGRAATGVFHLWHPPLDRSNEARHWASIANVFATGRILPGRGLSSFIEC